MWAFRRCCGGTIGKVFASIRVGHDCDPWNGVDAANVYTTNLDVMNLHTTNGGNSGDITGLAITATLSGSGASQVVNLTVSTTADASLSQYMQVSPTRYESKELANSY